MRKQDHSALAVAAVGGLVFALDRLAPPDAAAPTDDAAGWAAVEFHPPLPGVVFLRCRAKELLAEEVAAGRRSLWEAAALFGALNRLPPEPGGPLAFEDAEVSIPTATEAGRLCSQVARWVLIRPGRSLAESRAAVARLVTEFRAELRARGGIRLPDPAGLEPAESLIARVRPSPEAPAGDAHAE
jgi:hypothetical protein